jgi:hypothetical protein
MKKKDSFNPEDLGDYIDLICSPTMYFTRSSDKKIVRALGEIGIWFPMLPWTVFAIVCGAILGLFSWAVYAFFMRLCDFFSIWWEDV